MPITRSAKKAVRSSARKKVLNDSRRRTMREEIKSVKSLTGKGKEKETIDLSKAYKAIDKAAKSGVIKKNTAARKKSRLAVSVAKTK
ncbi:MAG: 30S ribosomal protein S20 [Candidatus Yonathbacteria bacterium]|nr:30S ribosomal protein S20 [Candidatus Yonathbacteria bacterium]